MEKYIEYDEQGIPVRWQISFAPVNPGYRTEGSAVIGIPDEPTKCLRCGARRQYNVDNEIVHARSGTVECPDKPFAEVDELSWVNVPAAWLFDADSEPAKRMSSALKLMRRQRDR